MEKIASRNSMTYLKPTQWWMKLFNFKTKCQGLDFFGQINQGVEVFDLRFKWVDGIVHFGHGLVTYSISKHDPEYVLGWLNALSARLNRQEGRKICVRVICECPKDREKFKSYCAYIDHHFKELVFFGGRDKKTWKVLYDFQNPCPDLVDKYAPGWHLDDLWPRIYAMFFNKYWRKKYKNTDKILMQDFVGVY